MKQVLDIDGLDYKITISDDSFLKLVEEIDSFTSGKKRLFVVSKNVYKLYAILTKKFLFPVKLNTATFK